MKPSQPIVKTRHKKAGKPVGVLYPEKGKLKFSLQRYLPVKELRTCVEHYWIVRWDLRGEPPYLSETLPHPSVHIVFEKNNTRVIGIMKSKFSRELKDAGKVLGIKFNPGGFYPFIKSDVSALTDKEFLPHEVLDNYNLELENIILSADDDEDMIAPAEKFLLERLPGPDNNVQLLKRIAERIISGKDITRVEDIAGEFNINKRTLERLFSRYVGITPKWMIKRYRLHEASERLASERNIDLVQLALNLGYFDQSHFIKDFKSIVGKTPAEYLKENSGI